MTALDLFLIAVWFWFVLVNVEKRHMRSAIFWPFIFFAVLAISVILIAADKAFDALKYIATLIFDED